MLAVVVASKDRRELLLETLPRHLALPERPEVVLVDDASSDGTPDAVRAALPEVRVVGLERSRGAAARNTGLRATAADVVALADDDSWWAPGALARAQAAFAADPRLGLLQARVLVGPDERPDPTLAHMEDAPLLGFVACGVVLRRDAVLEVGGFAERFGVGGEEELLAYDLAAAGWGLRYDPGLVAFHHPTGDPRPERRAREVRNALWTTWLRRSPSGALLRTARIVAGARDPHAVRGIADAVAGLPSVLRDRRPNPPEVERLARLLDRTAR